MADMGNKSSKFWSDQLPRFVEVPNNKELPRITILTQILLQLFTVNESTGLMDLEDSRPQIRDHIKQAFSEQSLQVRQTIKKGRSVLYSLKPGRKTSAPIDAGKVDELYDALYNGWGILRIVLDS